LSEVTTLDSFIKSEMRHREMNIRQFAKMVGVSHSTLLRYMDENNEDLPTLEFLIKLSTATSTDLCTLVAMVAPDRTPVRPSARIIADRIARLSEDDQRLIDTLLITMSLKSKKSGDQ
jgi:transcriptional regulator with XRE-family HTH domain